ncbi:unnamed protein product [Absidia cylindrospora]
MIAYETVVIIRVSHILITVRLGVSLDEDCAACPYHPSLNLGCCLFAFGFIERSDDLIPMLHHKVLQALDDK